MSNISETHTGFFSRMKSALVGIFFGILMIPGSVILLGWNEYQTLHRSRGLNEASETVQTVSDPSTIDEDREQQLVHMTGLADTTETLRDEEFQVEQHAIKLTRQVEMYQWEEDEHTRSKSRTGGSRSSRTEYSYHKRWCQGRNASESFHNSNGHINPVAHFSQKQFVANQVFVGAYFLDDALKSSIHTHQSLPWTPEIISKFPEDLQAQVTVEGDYLYWSAHGTQGKSGPTLGDQRIKMEYVPPQDVSLISRQSGNTFSEFTVSNGEKIHNLYAGRHTAEEVVQKLRNENQMWAWIKRALGLALCTGGFSLILGPIAVIADVIPFLGSLTRGATFFVSLMLGICISAVTISVSWIAVRPLIGIPLLLVAAGCIYWIFRFARKNRSRADENPYRNVGNDDDGVEVVM